MTEHKSCNLKILKGFIEHEGDVLVVVGKQDCPNCRSFEGGGLAKFLAESKDDFALGTVNIDESDPKCSEIVSDLKLTSAPTVLAFKNGVEVERLVPTLDADKDAENLKKIVEKIREG
jgi:thioredoxin-like negative regulator of GroEL